MLAEIHSCVIATSFILNSCGRTDANDVLSGQRRLIAHGAEDSCTNDEHEVLRSVSVPYLRGHTESVECRIPLQLPHSSQGPCRSTRSYSLKGLSDAHR